MRRIERMKETIYELYGRFLKFLVIFLILFVFFVITYGLSGAAALDGFSVIQMLKISAGLAGILGLICAWLWKD